ncbi:MAG: site-specific integrase [Alphaproteobacteria bacterium]|jgi:integrase|nr:site-specific integrase [Alphaproteobacteria bacterium]
MTKLSKRTVDLATGPGPDSKNPKFYWDDTLKGFGLSVTHSGVKTYVVSYRNEDGKSKRMKIGRHGALTPEEARRLATAKLGDVAKGHDPATEKGISRKAPTIRDLASDYLTRHALLHNRESSNRDNVAYVEQIIIPNLGSKKVTSVSLRDIENLVQSLKKTPYKANRVRAVLSKMFNLARQWKWREDNPVEGVKKFQETPRVRWLQVDELEKLFDALGAQENQVAANAIRLLLLTGARKSEVFKSTWDQFDLGRGVWIKLAHYTKQNRMEQTPLSGEALNLIHSIRATASDGSTHLFPGAVPGRPISDISRFWRKVCGEAGIEDFRMHDLRHTFASHLASSGQSLHIIGRLIGHTQSQTTMKYAHLADQPLRAATEAFGLTIESLTARHSEK